MRIRQALHHGPTLLALCFLLEAGAGAVADDPVPLHRLASHNVVWDTPSEDMHGSMPIGNGDLAANFWVEPSGDLVFYLSKSDSWDGDQELLKLGRVRIRLDKPFVRDGRPFRQELDLARGCIVLESGAGDDKTTVDFWIDANRPVVNVQIKGAEAFTAQVALEHWPKETWATPQTLKVDTAKGDAKALRGDTILPAEDNTIRWYYRNTTSIFAETLKNQHLGHAVEKFHDPLLNLTFGGLIAGEGLVTKDDRTLATAAPVKSLDIRIHALTAQTPEPAAWISQLDALRAANDKVASAEARPAHEQWWKDFWTRSWIFPEGTDDAKAVGRAYALQRWIQAGAGRGAYPIKFNGSLFTVDGFMDKKGVYTEYGPDWRRWGGPYWFQNTRELYWAMLYSGDYDQMEPLWKMYRDAVPLLKERTKTYFNHEGIFCSETMLPWGLNKLSDFGKHNKGLYPSSPFIRYYWDSGNELSQMMFDFVEHTENEEFAKNTLIPIADGVVTFYQQHFPKPDQGKPRFTPAMSLETYHVAEDPFPVLVGLRTVLTRLLELPESLTTPEQRERWSKFLAELPDYPMAEENGKRRFLPALTYSERKNSENPELYGIFPYRVHGLGKPEFETALETWRRRDIKQTGGWRQDSIQAALLGLTDEAKDYVLKNATNQTLIGAIPKKPSRFPAFWGPNFDGTPDQCQGSVIMIALQRMLMQCDADAIRLLPAWPKDWNASFKLHAPKNTTVEGRIENGELRDLKVTPEARRKDVILGADTSKNP
jgi:alpha-L-fucosidase 2